MDTIRLMDLKEAAKYLGIGINKMRDQVAERKVDFYRISEGSPYRFKKEDLDKWLERHRQPAQTSETPGQ